MYKNRYYMIRIYGLNILRYAKGKTDPCKNLEYNVFLFHNAIQENLSAMSFRNSRLQFQLIFHMEY